MVNGWNYLELAQATENDERCSGVTNAILVDKQLDNSNKSSKPTKVVNSTGVVTNTLANEKKIGVKLHEEVVRFRNVPLYLMEEAERQRCGELKAVKEVLRTERIGLSLS